jgi:hypothetical protein
MVERGRGVRVIMLKLMRETAKRLNTHLLGAESSA